MFEDKPAAVPPELGTVSADRRGDLTDFWFICVARGTALVYLSFLLALSVIIVKADIAVDELSFGAAIQDLLAAAFWSFLMLVGTCYFSIPIATLVVAAWRGVLRHRRREIDPAGPTDQVAI